MGVNELGAFAPRRSACSSPRTAFSPPRPARRRPPASTKKLKTDVFSANRGQFLMSEVPLGSAFCVRRVGVLQGGSWAALPRPRPLPRARRPNSNHAKTLHAARRRLYPERAEVEVLASVSLIALRYYPGLYYVDLGLLLAFGGQLLLESIYI